MITMPLLDILTARGVPMRVVLYLDDADGRANSPYPAAFQDRFSHVDQPTVEFYDRRYPHTPQGQFTGGRYYVASLLDGRTGGLRLYGGVDAWTVDAATMDLVRSWLKAEVAR